MSHFAAWQVWPWTYWVAFPSLSLARTPDDKSGNASRMPRTPFNARAENDRVPTNWAAQARLLTY